MGFHGMNGFPCCHGLGLFNAPWSAPWDGQSCECDSFHAVITYYARGAAEVSQVLI